MNRVARRLLGLALPAVAVLAVATTSGRTQDGAPKKYMEGARLEQHEAMYSDKHGTYGPADGGGSAKILEQPDPPPAHDAAARYVLEYTAGELGIATGGAIFFQVSPFWGWSTPVPVDAGGGGRNTRVTCGVASTRLECEVAAPGCLSIRVAEGSLPAGAKVTIEYGVEGPLGGLPRVDWFAEAEEAFYFWVDGDGDGSRKLIASDPHVAILPGPAVDLAVTASSEAAVGGTIDVTLAFLDVVANAARDAEFDVELSGDGLELPAKLEFRKGQPSHRRITAKALTAGVHTVVATIRGSRIESNPILVSETPRRVLWADLHGHSSLSDGTGTPEDYYAYARDVAGLDVAVLTDHDHWGLRKLDQEPALWQRIRDVTARFDEPGRFTTVLGYEWTSWLYGHRHVLYFDGEGEVLSSLDDATMTPTGLWDALRQRKANALTFPHHPAGSAVCLDWSFQPDPDFEPVVEICSVHGVSEEPHSPRPIREPVKGHFVRDALAMGYQLGFVGSGDTHNGHPGFAHLAQPCGGVAAILAPENTRAAVRAALKAKTCYATTGPRILVWFRHGAARMGSTIAPPVAAPDASAGAPAAAPASPDAAPKEPPYAGLVIGTAPIARVELVKNGAVVASVEGNGSFQAAIDWLDPQRAAGDSVYLRAIQTDSHAAFASPIFTR